MSTLNHTLSYDDNPLPSEFVIVPSASTAGVSALAMDSTDTMAFAFEPSLVGGAFEFIQASEVDTVMQGPVAPVAGAAKTKAKRKRAPKKSKQSPEPGPDSSNKVDDELALRLKQVQARITALQSMESMVEAVESVPPTLVPTEVKQGRRVLFSAARDTFFHARPVDTDAKVQKTDIDAEVAADAAYQDSLDFATLRHPKSPFLRCIPCLRTLSETKIWANRSGGLTKCMRDHMEKYHTVTYYAKCQKEGLTERCANMGSPGMVQPEFTRPGLVDRLVDWAVSNDEPLNVVDDPEFRDLILYCGQGRIKDQDVPHRDKLATAAWAMYLLEKVKIDQEMKRARGRISLTSDLWSDGSLRSFMAVTAHYINASGDLKDHLISFRKIDGQHTGANIGRALFQVLQESDIVHQVGCITLDNASNNNTLMQELAIALGEHGAEFDAERNRIRCFPHVMNLAVNAILKSLAETASSFRKEMQESDLAISDETERYLQALESLPINIVRASVHACRSSGQRREGLRRTIEEGNRLGRFYQPGGAVNVIPILQLLRDVPTRWSSTYNMVKRYLILHPAIAIYAFEVRNEFQVPVASHKQYEVLQDILSVLTVAHNAQELLSAEKTPTLALAFPVYEAVVENWQQLSVVIPELAHSITTGISKIQEYILRTQDAPVHTLSMFVNPSLKLDWIDQHWTPSQTRQSEAVVKSAMLRFQTQIDSKSRALRASNAASKANRAQNSGYLRLLNAGNILRRASATRSGHETVNLGRSSQPSTSQSSSSIPQSLDSSIQARNQAIVDAEFSRYITSESIPAEEMGSLELTEYWKVHQFTYPLLFRIAMDVLPVQASSVSSERVFSSSKLTCTSERNRITPENMEYLQVLKHALIRRHRELSDGSAADDLDFVSHLYENLSLEDD